MASKTRKRPGTASWPHLKDAWRAGTHADQRSRYREPTRASALGYREAVSFNGNLTKVEAFDASAVLQARTTRFFDEVNRVWKVQQDRFGPGLTASYPTTIFTRDAGHLLAQVTDPLSRSTSYAYDNAGRLSTVTDAAGNVRTFTRDANGNPTQVADAEVPATGPTETFVTEFDYDVLNRRTEMREIDRLNASNILTTTFEYDSRSNLTFRTDAEGHPVRWTYDLASRLTTYERALQVGASIDTFVSAIEETFAYDASDRLVTVTDDNFNSTGYTYDALGRRTRTTYADARYVQYVYDENSNLEEWTDQNGTVVENSFDALDRLTLRAVTKGTGVLGSTYESFTYDALSRMLTAKNDAYQVVMAYDSVGNLLSDQQGYNVLGGEQWKTVSSSYTDAGATASIAYPSGFALTHTRDAIDRMTVLHDATASVNVATFTWQGPGRRATTSNQNGTGTTYAWDGFRRIAEIDHTLSGGGSLHKFEYAYDKVHNRRMEKNSFDATWMATLPTAAQTFLGGRNGKGEVFAYDMAYRLIDARFDVTNPATEVASPGTQPYAKLVQYTIDGLGNRSQVQTTPPTPPTAVTYATDVVNQYTTIGGVTRGHDNNGNLKDDGTHLFGYDFENRLVEVKLKSTSALVATYTYDALGRRVEKVVAAGSTTRFLLDGVQVVEEYDGSGAWQARYLYEDGIDRPRAMDRADVADVNGNANTAEVLRFHYHQQALGSVTEISQPTGAVIEWVTYDVYGAATIRNRFGATVTSSAVGNPWLFTGREFDPESGLYHYRARAYDAVAGRFLQRDPLGFVDGLGLHEYVRTRPPSAVDPLGLRDPDRDIYEGGGLPSRQPGTPHYDPDRGGNQVVDPPKDKEAEANNEVFRDALDLVKEFGPEWAKQLLNQDPAPDIWIAEIPRSRMYANLFGLWTPFARVEARHCERVRGKRGTGIEIQPTVAWQNLLEAILHELRHLHQTVNNGNIAPAGPDKGHPADPKTGVEEGNDPEHGSSGGSGKDGWGEKDRAEARTLMSSAMKAGKAKW